METWTTIIIILLVVAFFINKFLYDAKRSREHADTAAEAAPDFSPELRLSGDKNILGLDTGRRKIGFIGKYGGTWKVYSASDIVSAEVFEDGQSILKARRATQVGMGLVGGAVAGGVGALIGGLGTVAKSTDVVHYIQLRLVVNDSEAPIQDVTLLNTKTRRNSFTHRTFDQQAREWHARLENLIRSAEQEAAKASPEQLHKQVEMQSSASSSSKALYVADELEKLVALRDAGVLDDKEFKMQKAKILSVEN